MSASVTSTCTSSSTDMPAKSLVSKSKSDALVSIGLAECFDGPSSAALIGVDETGPTPPLGEMRACNSRCRVWEWIHIMAARRHTYQ
jgi:hypothetical protein